MLCLPKTQFFEPSNFYRHHHLDHGPSSFAQFVVERYKDFELIIDCACGNGRDTTWFSHVGLRSIGLDAAMSSITVAKRHSKAQKSQIEFICMDLTDKSFFNILCEKISNPWKTILYSRFFHHAIDSLDEEKFVDNILPFLKSGSIYCMESRAVGDEVHKKLYGQHYRRFISLEKLSLLFSERGVSLIYSQISRGLARLETEDPMILRATFGVLND